MNLITYAALSLFLLATARAEERKGIEYSRPGGVRLRMDAHLPPGSGPFPAVILVHGGAWVAGSRRFDVKPLFKPLSGAGFAWFTISYRLARKTSFSGSVIDTSKIGSGIDDVQSAVQFLRDHAAEFHVDPNRIALIGVSSGAQLASMAAIRGSPVKAVVAFYCPSDLVALALPPGVFQAAAARLTWGSPPQSQLLRLSPLAAVRPGMPPFLFIHGTLDHVVPFDQSIRMCDAMRKAGSACEVISVKGGLHGIQLWEALHNTGYKRQMTEWLGARLN